MKEYDKLLKCMRPFHEALIVTLSLIHANNNQTKYHYNVINKSEFDLRELLWNFLIRIQTYIPFH